MARSVSARGGEPTTSASPPEADSIRTEIRAPLHIQSIWRARCPPEAENPRPQPLRQRRTLSGLSYERHFISEIWRARWDSNPRPQPPQGCALSGLSYERAKGATEVTPRQIFELVPKGGFEPPRPLGHCALNAARLPFRHFGLLSAPARCRTAAFRDQPRTAFGAYHREGSGSISGRRLLGFPDTRQSARSVGPESQVKCCYTVSTSAIKRARDSGFRFRREDWATAG